VTRSESASTLHPLGTLIVKWIAAFGAIGVVAGAALHTGLSASAIQQIELAHLQSQAALVAAAVDSCPPAKIAECLDRLQERCDGMIAAAFLDPGGKVIDVYPGHPMARLAAETAPRDGTTGRLDTLRSGSPLVTRGIEVPVNGDPSPLTQRLLVVFSQESQASLLGRSAAWFVILLSLVAAACGGLIRVWTRRRIEGPLHLLAHRLDETERAPGVWEETVPARITEIVRLAKGVASLQNDLAAGEFRLRQFEKTMTREIQKNRAGFDRQLRLARDKASIDPLSGIRNRAFLEAELETLFEQSREAPADLSAVMIDLDNFKLYNDTHGHYAGDALLRFIGKLLRGCLRPRDYAVRYGGDEFLLLLPDTEIAQATCVADRIIKLFGQYATTLGQPDKPSLSAGLASIRADAPCHGHDLVAMADSALYQAKRGGKNRVVIRTTETLSAAV